MVRRWRTISSLLIATFTDSFQCCTSQAAPLESLCILCDNFAHISYQLRDS